MQARPRRALIVTDVHLVAWALSSAFGPAGFVALTAETAAGASDALRTVEDIDILVISLSIGPSQVSDLLATTSREFPGTRSILLAAEPDVAFPVPAKVGVLLQLPFSVDDVVATAGELVGDSRASTTADAARSASRAFGA
jgi:DNA-binding NtrC family response regulator